MLYRIRQNDRYGFIDETGTVVIKPIYDLIGEIRFGACVMVKEEKFGLISLNGDELLPPQYASLGIIGENRICISETQQFALAGFNGKLLTKFAYGGVFDFSEGMVLAYKGLKFGYLDEEGKEKIPFEYDFAESFENGYAMVKQARKTGLLNKSGIFEKAPSYDFYYVYENCYVINIGGTVYDDHVTGGKFGILSKNNIELTKPEFDFIGYFQQGEAVVMKDGLYGRIDEKGQLIVPINSKEPVRAVEKFQKVIKANKVGLTAIDGNEIIPSEYEDLMFYPESDLCWAKQNGLYGILTLENNFIVPPSFKLKTIYPIRKEEVHIEMPSGKHGLLAIPSGKWILPPEYDSIGVFKGSLVELEKDGRMSYANREGRIVWME
jgi:hypothetical protein